MKELLHFQWSRHGETDWHDDFKDGDRFIRVSVDCEDWSVPRRIVGEDRGGWRIESARCARCGTLTPFDQLECLPTWVTMGGWRWRLRVIDGRVRFAQLAAIEDAADRGDEFDRHECAACYGPGYNALAGNRWIARLKAWWRRARHRSAERTRALDEDRINGVPAHMVW